MVCAESRLSVVFRDMVISLRATADRLAQRRKAGRVPRSSNSGAADCLTGKSVNLVQPPLQKYFASPQTQISSISLTVPSHRGALAIVIDAGRDAVDAAASGTQRDRRAR